MKTEWGKPTHFLPIIYLDKFNMLCYKLLLLTVYLALSNKTWYYNHVVKQKELQQ